MCAYDPTETYRKISFRNIPHKVRLWKIEKILKKESLNKKLNSYLDIGCASGFITQRLKQLLDIQTVCGTDALNEYIVEANDKYSEITFEVMDLNREIKTEKKFDLVTCFETLEHVGYLQTALDNVTKFKTPGGIALISVPIEVGIIGIIKYILKVNIYGDKLNEIGIENKNKYLKKLLKGQDISIFRHQQKELWWDHFGFNYKVIEKYFEKEGIKFKAQTFFTTRFILVHH